VNLDFYSFLCVSKYAALFVFGFFFVCVFCVDTRKRGEWRGCGGCVYRCACVFCDDVVLCGIVCFCGFCVMTWYVPLGDDVWS